MGAEDPFSEVIRARRYPLSQDKYWFNASRRFLLVDDIAPEYRFNILNFIIRSADTYYHTHLCLLQVRKIKALVDEGSCSYDRLIKEVSQQTARSFNDLEEGRVIVEEWVETTPLVKKLRRTLEQDKADGYIYF